MQRRFCVPERGADHRLQLRKRGAPTCLCKPTVANATVTNLTPTTARIICDVDHSIGGDRSEGAATEAIFDCNDDQVPPTCDSLIEMLPAVGAPLLVSGGWTAQTTCVSLVAPETDDGCRLDDIVWFPALPALRLMSQMHSGTPALVSSNVTRRHSPLPIFARASRTLRMPV